jgi:chromosome segregation ATPase
MDPKKKAREHLVAAEKHIKNSEFDNARNEVLKAQELDPSNVYTFAFLERIDFFNQQSTKDEPVPTDLTLSGNVIDNDSPQQPPETDGKPTLEETPIAESKLPTPTTDLPDQIQPQDAIYIAILNSIEDYQNQSTALSNRVKESEGHKNLIRLKEKADIVKGKINAVRNTDREDQDAASYDLNEKIILEIEQSLHTFDEHMRSFQDSIDESGITHSYQSSLISSLEQELADFKNSIQNERDTYSEENIREELAGFERRLDELTQSVESKTEIGDTLKQIQSLLDTIETRAQELSLSRVSEETRSRPITYIEELTNKVDQLQQSIRSQDEIQKTTEGLRLELSHMESQLQKLNDDVRNLPKSTSEFDEIREQIKNLASQFNAAGQPITDLEQQVQQLQQDIRKTVEMPESVDRSDELRSEVVTLKSELEKINTDVRNALHATSGLDDLREQIKALTSYLDTVGKPLLDLEQRVQQLSQGIPQNGASPDELSTLSKFHSEMFTLKSELEKLSDEVHNRPQSPTGLEAFGESLYEFEQRIEQLGQEIRQKADLPEGIGDLNEFRSEIIALKHELEKVSGEVRNATEGVTGLDELHRQVKDITSRLDASGEPLSDLEQKIQQLGQDIRQKADLPDGIGDLNEFRSEIIALKHELEKVSGEVRNATEGVTGLDELHRQVKDITSRLDASGEPLSDLEQKIQQLGQDIRQKADLPDGIGDLNEFRSEIIALKHELEKVSGEVRNATEGITGLNELRQQVREIILRVDASGEPLFDLEQRIRQLAQDIRQKADLPEGIEDLNEFRFELLTLKDELGKVSEEVRGTKEGITGLNELRSQIKSLTVYLDKIGEPLFELEQRVQLLSNDIQRKANLPDGIEDLNIFRSEISTIQAELGKISVDVQKVLLTQTALDNLDHKVQGLSSRLGEFGKPLSDLEQRVDRINQEITVVSRQIEITEKLQKEVASVQEKTNQLQSLPAQIENLIDTQLHITGNYADLEQRLQDFILDGTNKFVGHEHIESLKNDILSLRKQLDDIATTAAKIQDFQQAHSKTISWYKDLEERFVAFIKNQSEQRDVHTGELKKHAATLENQLSAIQNESLRKHTDFENRLSRFTDTIKSLKLKLDYEIESLHASGINQESYQIIEERLRILEEKREKEQQDYQSTLTKITDQLTNLTNKVESDQHAREESEKRKLDIGLKYFKSAAEDAWEYGEPEADRAVALQNLADLFSIPDSIEKEIIREIKLRRYSQAVKKAISDKKTYKKDGPSLEQLRQLYAISLEEYMEYESIFLDELVSTRFHGTIMVISDDTSTCDDLLERLKTNGFTVSHVSKPETAPEKIDSVNPLVVICETTFLTANNKGIELLRDLRKDKKYNHMPFILIAEPYEIAAVKKELREIYDAVLIKPVDFYDLLDTIDDKLKKVRDQLSSQNLE